MRKHILCFTLLVAAAYAAIAHKGVQSADNVRSMAEERIERMEQLYK